MNLKNCVICNKKFKTIYSTKLTCSKKCSIENKKQYQKRYFSDVLKYEKHKKQMREYMKRPDVMKKEKIRKRSPKYKAWWKKYSLTKEYKENQNRRARKSKLKRDMP